MASGIPKELEQILDRRVNKRWRKNFLILAVTFTCAFVIFYKLNLTPSLDTFTNVGVDLAFSLLPISLVAGYMAKKCDDRRNNGSEDREVARIIDDYYMAQSQNIMQSRLPTVTTPLLEVVSQNIAQPKPTTVIGGNVSAPTECVIIVDEQSL